MIIVSNYIKSNIGSQEIDSDLAYDVVLFA